MKPVSFVLSLALTFLFSGESHAAALRIQPVQLAVSPEARIAQLHPHFGPQAQAFIAREAERELSSGMISIAQAQSAAGAVDLGAVNSSDNDALIFAVMLQILADGDAELRNEIAIAKNLARAKQAARAAALQNKERDVATGMEESSQREESTGDNAQGVRTVQSMPRLQPLAPRTPRYTLDQYISGRATSFADAQQELQNQLDSMSELSETEELRLQMMMDRRAKAIEELSNLLKKESETKSSIIGNLK